MIKDNIEANTKAEKLTSWTVKNLFNSPSHRSSSMCHLTWLNWKGRDSQFSSNSNNKTLKTMNLLRLKIMARYNSIWHGPQPTKRGQVIIHSAIVNPQLTTNISQVCKLVSSKSNLRETTKIIIAWMKMKMLSNYIRRLSLENYLKQRCPKLNAFRKVNTHNKEMRQSKRKRPRIGKFLWKTYPRVARQSNTIRNKT